MQSYYYMNDFPLTVANGGKENQLVQVRDFLKPLFNDRIFCIHDINAPKIKSGDVLHCFGDTPLFYYLIEFLRGSGIYPKVIISPSFFRKPAVYYTLLKLIPRGIPNWYSERQKLYNIANVIVVNSSLEKDYMLKIFNLDKNKIKIIHNSFTNRFFHVEDTIHVEEKYCLCVSHLSERKNIFELLKAGEKFYHKTGVKLYLAGGLRFHSDKNLKKFEELVKKLEGVKFLGLQNRSQLSRLYSSCLFHVLPSFIETPGISNLEAASFKKPIVVGDFPVLSEYFSKDAIYTKFDHASILNAMFKALEASEQGDVEYDLDSFLPNFIQNRYIRLINELL